MESTVYGDESGLAVVVSGSINYADKIAEEVAEFKRRFLERLGPEVLDRIRERTPVFSGLLRDSWTFHSQGSSFVCTTGIPYASIIEYGWYKGLGPRTAKGPDGGIYSSQAVGGMVRPTLADIQTGDYLDQLAAQVLQEILEEYGE